MLGTQRSLNCTALNGATVVLTGASRGIGLEISRLLAEQKANIIGIARSQTQLEQWSAEMSGYGIQAEKVVFDLSQTNRLADLAGQIRECSQRLASRQIDVLVNNAGIEIYRAFQHYKPEEIETVIRVNLTAPMTLSRLLLPHLSPQGQIVNMASLAGKKGHPYDSAYAASKAGLLMWSHSLRQEMARSDQTVSVICPGYVADSGMLADTGVPAPFLAGRSPAKAVAKAVLKAIRHRPAEVIVNQDPITETATRILLAAEQLFPRLADFSNRQMGITRLNQQRIRPPASVQ
ncbi:MAG: SDR family NAD(P)-dependent oxidoreductase [Cyanobacteria bacterium J06627_28]